jgi:hypothetical protein
MEAKKASIGNVVIHQTQVKTAAAAAVYCDDDAHGDADGEGGSSRSSSFSTTAATATTTKMPGVNPKAHTGGARLTEKACPDLAAAKRPTAMTVETADFDKYRNERMGDMKYVFYYTIVHFLVCDSLIHLLPPACIP